MPKDFIDFIMFLFGIILGFLYLFKHLRLIGVRTKGHERKR